MPHHIHAVLQSLAQLRALNVTDLTSTVAANWQRLIAGDKRLEPWARFP